jgi:phosphoglycolate phosphatase-like HAD superfamily hydrolase
MATKFQNGRDSMRIEPAFLFDLDGTLVDSVYQHVLAWKEARRFGDDGAAGARSAAALLRV